MRSLWRDHHSFSTNEWIWAVYHCNISSFQVLFKIAHARCQCCYKLDRPMLTTLLTTCFLLNTHYIWQKGYLNVTLQLVLSPSLKICLTSVLEVCFFQFHSLFSSHAWIIRHGFQLLPGQVLLSFIKYYCSLCLLSINFQSPSFWG